MTLTELLTWVFICGLQLDEMTALYDQSQRDNRAKAGEIQRLNVENDKLKDQNSNLGRENKKLEGQRIVYVKMRGIGVSGVNMTIFIPLYES